MPQNSKASVGKKWLPPTSAEWNNMLEAGEAWSRGRFDVQAPNPTPPRATDIIKVRNDTGEQRYRGEVVGIGGPIVSELTAEYTWLSGSLPSPSYGYGILKKDVAPGEIEELQVSGECIAVLNITSMSNRFASIEESIFNMQSADAGEVEILWRPPAFGLQECVVRFTNSPPAVRIRFVTAAAIVDRVVPVIVTQVIGAARDPVIGNLLHVNDVVEVTDPNNLFGDIEEDGIGWANWKPPIKDASGNVLMLGRYEIETCSLPVDELTCELIECLKNTDATLTVRYVPHKTRSSFPNSMEPPEINEDDEIEVQNPNKLDGCTDSKCVIKRVTNKHFGDPTLAETPATGSATTKQWELISVEKRKARWIVISYTSGDGSQVDESFTVVDHWEGEDPEECCEGEITLSKPLGEPPCPLQNALFMCPYRPEHDDYALGLSISAQLGAPLNTTFIVGDSLEWSAEECGTINYTKRTMAFFECCDDNCIEQVSLPWPGSVTPVITGVSYSTDAYGYGGGEACLVFTRGYALVCDTSSADPLYICGDNCCTEKLHYKILMSGDPVPDGATDVGGYSDGGPSKYVAEKCIAEDGDKTGWTLGNGESIPTGTFTRTEPSPECCPEG